MFPRTRSIRTGVTAAAVLGVTGTARAEGPPPLMFQAEAAGGAMLSQPQREQLGIIAAFEGAVRLGVRVHPRLGVRVSGAYTGYPVRVGDPTATLYGTAGAQAGLRIDPCVGNVGRFWIDLDVGVGFTGTGRANVRPAGDLGLGFDFRLAPMVALGPFARASVLVPIPGLDTLSVPVTLVGGVAMTVELAPHARVVAPPPAPAAPPPPPADTDHDGVLDPADLCPSEPAGEHPDNARSGCPQRDADGDGVLDAADQCPQQTAGARADAQRAGCPMGDADSDGVLDGDDLCVSEAAGAHADPSRAGCPATDRDHDGVFDPADQCPEQPLGMFPDDARAGCPSPDRDQDGVVDAADHCPDRPGTPSTDPARNGCPGQVLIVHGVLQLNSVVNFRTGNAELRSASGRILGVVADVLRATPQIRRLAVEGHTDDADADDANQRLSEARAAAVVQWLVAHGVDAARLEAHGYGETRPVVPITPGMERRALRTAREQNRRVVFRVVDPPQDPPAQ